MLHFKKQKHSQQNLLHESATVQKVLNFLAILLLGELNNIPLRDTCFVAYQFNFDAFLVWCLARLKIVLVSVKNNHQKLRISFTVRDNFISIVRYIYVHFLTKTNDRDREKKLLSSDIDLVHMQSFNTSTSYFTQRQMIQIATRTSSLQTGQTSTRIVQKPLR